MHKLLIRAIITGFGLRLGAELGKYVAQKVFPKAKDAAEENEEAQAEDESLGSVLPNPTDPADPTDPTDPTDP